MTVLDLEFAHAKEASTSTFGYVCRDISVAHRALGRGHTRWCYRIIDQQLPEYKRADADLLVGPLKKIHDALTPVDPNTLQRLLEEETARVTLEQPRARAV